MDNSDSRRRPFPSILHTRKDIHINISSHGNAFRKAPASLQIYTFHTISKKIPQSVYNFAINLFPFCNQVTASPTISSTTALALFFSLTTAAALPIRNGRALSMVSSSMSSPRVSKSCSTGITPLAVNSLISEARFLLLKVSSSGLRRGTSRRNIFKRSKKSTARETSTFPSNQNFQVKKSVRNRLLTLPSFECMRCYGHGEVVR